MGKWPFCYSCFFFVCPYLSCLFSYIQVAVFLIPYQYESVPFHVLVFLLIFFHLSFSFPCLAQCFDFLFPDKYRCCFIIVTFGSRIWILWLAESTVYIFHIYLLVWIPHSWKLQFFGCNVGDRRLNNIFCGKSHKSGSPPRRLQNLKTLDF